MVSKLRVALAAIGLAALAAASPAGASFPGANGKIAFVHSAGGPAEVFVMNADGTGRAPLTSGPARNVAPAWSPDGTKIAFASYRDDPNPGGCNPCNTEIYVMDANGGNQTRLTNDPSLDGSPSWSPDGTKIAFYSNRTGAGDIYSMNADGTGAVRLTTSPDYDETPSWSPDGTRIAYTKTAEVRLMNPDGKSQTALTTDSDSPFEPDWSPDATTIDYQEHACCDPSDSTQQISTIHLDGTGFNVLTYGTSPAWAPDGSRIAIASQACRFSAGLYFCSDKDIVTMNPNGSGQVNLTNNGTGEASGQPSWQSILAYVRPKGATPLLASLVPAFKACGSPNDTHGSPLAFGSCNPPQLASSFLAVGTPDANGQGANAIGSVLMKTFSCAACAGPGPNADVRFDVSITDVRKKADLSDYTGQVRVDAALRLTDRANAPNPGGPGPGTVSDTDFPFPVSCTSTADAAVGSTCSTATTANAVMPGAVLAGQRAIWQLGPVQVYDGGPSGVAGASDATLFMDQGIFVP